MAVGWEFTEGTHSSVSFCVLWWKDFDSEFCQKSRQIWELPCIFWRPGGSGRYCFFLTLVIWIRFSLPLLAVQGWDEVDDFVDYLWRWTQSFDSHSGDSRWSPFWNWLHTFVKSILVLTISFSKLISPGILRSRMETAALSMEEWETETLLVERKWVLIQN